MTRLLQLGLGTLGFSVLSSLYIAFFEPGTWRDGQFVVVYFVMLPVGLVCSAVALFTYEHIARGQRKDAALIAWSGAVALVVLGAAVGITPALIAAGGFVVWGAIAVRRTAWRN